MRMENALHLTCTLSRGGSPRAGRAWLRERRELSAWESERSGLLCSLTCLARCLEMTVANRWLPGLMAR